MATAQIRRLGLFGRTAVEILSMSRPNAVRRAGWVPPTGNTPSWNERSRLVTLLLGSLLLCSSGFTAQPGDANAEKNWPAWRGPLRTGVSPTATPPTEWSEDQNVKWKVQIPGSGSATPIVWDDQVFLQTAVPTGRKAEPSSSTSPRVEAPGGRRGGRGSSRPQPDEVFEFVLLSLDRETGRTGWHRVVRAEVPHEGHHRDHGFASYSPVTDGEHIISYFGSRGLHCFDLQGNLRWEKDLGDMQTKMGFGEGSSPALSGSVVVVNWDHEGDDFIVALEKETGRELWRQPRDEDTTWATPLIVEHEGRQQVVTAATSKIRSYDLQSGDLVWQSEGLTANVIPTPVAGDGVVYATSGFRGNAMFAIRLGHRGELSGSDAILWSHRKGAPYVPSPLLYGDRLYFFASNNNILSCLDAKTGRPLIDTERVEGLRGVYASPVGAAGRVYLVGRDGETVVIENASSLKILARNKLADGFDASPALAGNQLFLRGHQFVYCLAER